MNRRNEIKIEKINNFLRKQVFSGAYIVRNTLCVMGLATVVSGTVFAADVISDGTKAAPKAAIVETAEVEETVAAETVVAEEESFTIQLTDNSQLDSASVTKLYSRFEEDGVVLTATNDANNLTSSETDMTDKFIVKTEGLNLRAEASEEGNILKVLNTGDTGNVIGTDGDWTIVSSETSEGYVKSEYIIVGDEATQIAKQAAEEGKTLRDVIGVEEAPATEVQVAEVETTEAVTEEVQPVEDIKSLEVATATTEATTVQVTTEATTQATTEVTTEATTEAATEAPAVAAADASDVYLIAAVCYAEAGNQSYDGQLAVASVIMNRVASGKWGSSVRDVIYAPNQFSTVYTSTFQNALSTGGSETSLAAAQAAVGGANNVPGLLSFRPTWYIDTSTLSNYVQIGDHVFF